jgi:hypothetical protein
MKAMFEVTDSAAEWIKAPLELILICVHCFISRNPLVDYMIGFYSINEY